MYCADIEIKENMTAEEIKKAEKKLESFRMLVGVLLDGSSDKIEIPIEFSKKLDFNARDLIATIGLKKWKDGNVGLINRFKKQLEKAEEMIRKSKEKLKDKQT